MKTAPINPPNDSCRPPWRRRLVPLACAAVLLSACAVGPDYVKPDAPVPQDYKEAKGWQPATPQDDIPRGDWWAVFGDVTLDALMHQVDINNYNIQAAEALYRQAHELTAQAGAALYPTVGASVSKIRAQGTQSTTLTGNLQDNYSALLSAAWELDLWGGLRRGREAASAAEQASMADLESARLSARAQLATSYFQLRVLDAQQALLRDTVQAYERALQITRNQLASGVVTPADVAQAESQLETARTSLLDTGLSRAQTEHAIALLVGKAPADFALEVGALTGAVPEVPAGVPSALLQRRPDIAAAERRMAAANAQIGVAVAAFYPSLTLSAQGGYQSRTYADWFTLPNRIWSVGPQLAATLFDGGARSAAKHGAEAAYDVEVATYRQTVLTAFQEVEDNLIALRLLAQQQQTQEAARNAAITSLTIVSNQYRAGTVTYLNVVQAQTTLLTAENNLLNIRNRRLAASVGLVKALGGGWEMPEPS
ncbi:efflux transporter outer membrane subunit [Azonexus sp.]|jgi:NodT family efflux transporter outer membrane factor (OMF) lipoprotein|uniref:efflux transporter outer membrane subunit n=1 Tax=Azonexus sp. TaxID=1872668 RepID=UPI00281D0367|nr:efflux transporter outer membrane subunit [Azonexus sp.]MDR1994194.1 efflux transporter outer membrane subunit [Azonexus sp.]